MQRGTVPSTSSRQIHTFSHSPQANIPRSKFNRSHGVKTTFYEGYLIPVLVDEMLPGDTFNIELHAFARMNTPIFPIMDNLYLETFFFAVPYRLVWDNWEKFNGFQVNPGDSTDYVIPQIDVTSVGVATGDLADYMGIPIKTYPISFNALHFRAYNLIWNEWFRDQNQQNSVTVETDNGPDTYSTYTLLKRGKRYDYFTSCLPFPQKGPDTLIPVSGSVAAPVVGDGSAPIFNNHFSDTSTLITDSTLGQNVTVGSFLPGNVLYWQNPHLEVDLDSGLTIGTINDLRLAFQTQKLYERDARGGTRYTEVIRSHFGVVSPDMRLQRPEYIGGGSTPVIVNPVAQTAQATSPSNTNVLGNLGAYGVCAPKGHGFVYSATEHMLVLGLVSVRADLNYQQGLERMWTRQTRFDYYWPALAHLGEQAVLNGEIYLQGTATDDEVFGYQERYAEYRYKPSQITGLFRSAATGSLDVWHLAQNFTALPVLGNTFIQESAPMSRIMAVTSEPDFIFDGFFSYFCVRPMPVYAVPGLVDHF